ncbi:MAG: urate oxidase, partial [Solirubrobacteraceae bacterium]|nr:urate oxidase [Solirubrobacteraceae bacterium]
KSQNRLMRVVRDTDRHEVRDVTVNVRLWGDFDHVYLEGDNTEIPATDTMKNTVFALGKTDFGSGSIEDFGKTLVKHFVATSPRVSKGLVELTEHPWVRLPADAPGSDHSFYRGSSGDHVAWVEGDGDTFTVKAGISDLFVLKSTASGFVGFERTAFTSLPETTDRILATVIDAQWTYADEVQDYQASWEAIHDILLRRFADHYSDSVQQTIFNICTAILEARPEVLEVTIELPNKHHNLVDLSGFGLDNPGEVFIATQDPFGLITGTVSRTDAA